MPSPSKVNNDLEKLPTIQVPKDAPTSNQKASNAPAALNMPWKSNGDQRRDLLIKKIESALAPLQQLEPEILEQGIKYGKNAIATYDHIKIRFAKEYHDRYVMLHSLPQHSAAYNIQKRFCDAMDEIENNFFKQLTSSDYTKEPVNLDIKSLERKIDIAQKSACSKSYRDNLEIINKQSSTIHKQFTDQYNGIFPESKKAIEAKEKEILEAKNEAWIKQSLQNIQELTAIASPQPTTAKVQAKDDSVIPNSVGERAALTAKLEPIDTPADRRAAKNQALRDSAQENVSAVTKTADAVKELRQTHTPNVVQEEQKNVASVAQTDPASKVSQTKAPTPKPSHTTASDKDEKQEQKNKLKVPLAPAVKIGRELGELGGHYFGVVTEIVAETIGSIVKTAILGAWDLAKAAAGKIAQLGKSSNTLAEENNKAAMQEKAAISRPKPTPAPVKSSQEDKELSKYVKGTEVIGEVMGGLTAGVAAIAFTGGAALGNVLINKVIDIGQQLYSSLTKPKQETHVEIELQEYPSPTRSNNNATAKEEKLQLGNHSPAAGRNAMASAAKDSTLADAPSATNAQKSTAPTFSMRKNNNHS